MLARRKLIVNKIAMILFLSVLAISVVLAASQEPFDLSHENFLEMAFESKVPAAQRVWIRDELKEEVEGILQHQVNFLRTQYWMNETTSVWILDEIGKEKPITSGIVITRNNGKSEIVGVKVLAFRETRGWEIKNAFFTDQFKGVVREVKNNSGQLSPAIDGITGATLSVRALKKTAEIALLLDDHVRKQ